MQEKQLRETVARVVADRYAEAIIHTWFSHDLGEITDEQFLAQKKKLFEKAHETERLCGRLEAAHG